MARRKSRRAFRSLRGGDAAPVGEAPAQGEERDAPAAPVQAEEPGAAMPDDGPAPAISPSVANTPPEGGSAVTSAPADDAEETETASPPARNGKRTAYLTRPQVDRLYDFAREGFVAWGDMHAAFLHAVDRFKDGVDLHERPHGFVFAEKARTPLDIAVQESVMRHQGAQQASRTDGVAPAPAESTDAAVNSVSPPLISTWGKSLVIAN